MNKFARVWLEVVQGALGFGLELWVGLKTLETNVWEDLGIFGGLDYVALGFGWCLGGLLHLEVTYGWCLGGLLHLEVTFGWCLGGFATFGGDLWLMTWRLCYIWRWLLLVDVLETFLHLDLTFGGLLYNWSMMLGCYARVWRLTLEAWDLTWSSSWVRYWEALCIYFDYAWELIVMRVDDMAVISWWSYGWMSSGNDSLFRILQESWVLLSLRI